jgi:hypothetical protein
VITSPAIVTTNARHARITCSFFPNAAITTCASADFPRWISWGQEDEERHENNHPQDEREGDL